MFLVPLKNLTERVGMGVLFMLRRILQGVMEGMTTEENVAVAQAAVEVAVAITVEHDQDQDLRENVDQNHYLNPDRNHHLNKNHLSPGQNQNPGQNLSLVQNPDQSLLDVPSAEVLAETVVEAVVQVGNQSHP